MTRDKYTELRYYGEDDHERDLPWDEEEYEADRKERENRGMGQYRIVFDACGDRYYCNVEATTLWEAIGVFFTEHPHVTYEMIVDHTEV